ncbi:MAG: hypothetical protein M5T61_21515 [Acidimicrobiia bacterium]|nr:hypothetical protein [Acidimicrobiia bacterium]
MDLPDLNTFRSIRELQAHQAEIRQRITQMHTDAAGVPFNEEQRADFKALVDRDGESSARITEFEGREAIVERTSSTARPRTVTRSGPPARRGLVTRFVSRPRRIWVGRRPHGGSLTRTTWPTCGWTRSTPVPACTSCATGR